MTLSLDKLKSRTRDMLRRFDVCRRVIFFFFLVLENWNVGKFEDERLRFLENCLGLTGCRSCTRTGELRGSPKTGINKIAVVTHSLPGQRGQRK